MQHLLSRLFIPLSLLCLLSGCRLVSPTLHLLQSLSPPAPADQATTLSIGSPITVTIDAASGNEFSDSELQSLLAYVPNEPIYREYLAFGDVAAWYSATNMTPIDSVAEWQALEQPQRDLWAFALPIQTMPPEPLGLPYMLTQDMREFYGFSFLDAVRFIESGMPPVNFTVLETSADPAQIDAALLAFGYTANPVEGGTLYRIRRDNEMDLRSPSKVGQLGQLNRIVRIGDTLIIGRATDLVARAVNNLHRGTGTLADDPTYRALTGALTAPALSPLGELVGAILIGQPLAADPMMLAQENAAIQAQLDVYAQAPLPPYLALGLATHRMGEESYLTLVVVFPPSVDGAAAAATLGERLATYKSVTSKRVLTEYWSFAHQASVNFEGLSVALVSMQVTDKDASGALRTRPLAWSDLLFQRDLLFLLTGTPLRPE